MCIEYDDITAFHYSSYRPALHKSILLKIINNQNFVSGLDIGCGTGQSTLALTDFCVSVIGVDPSKAMLEKAVQHQSIGYELYDKKQLSFENKTFDVITMAGSLWYAKTQQLVDEISRVSKNKARVVVYDFQILLGHLLLQLNYKEVDSGAKSYNHEEDFKDLKTQNLNLIEKGSEKIKVQISGEHLAHLLLSVKSQYLFFTKAYGVPEVYDKLVAKLVYLSKANTFEFDVNTFHTLYHINAES